MQNEKYSKRIVTLASGSVEAEIFAPDGRRVGWELWPSYFTSNSAVEKRLQKAHKWADERIALCEKYEVIP